MWESDNCVTFDDRSLALHVSIPRTSDNDTRQSQHSVLHHAHQARPRPRPGDFYRLRNSPTPCQHVLSVTPTDCLRYLWARWFIASARSRQCKYLAPGWFLVTARMTECFLAPRSKQWRDTLFVQSLASLIRELIIWIRKRDPSTEPLSAITTIFAGSELWASRCLHQCQCHEGLRITKHKTFYLIPS